MAWQFGNTLKITYTFRDQSKDKVGYASYHIGELAGQVPNPNESEFKAFVSEFGDSLINASDCYVSDVSISMDGYNDAPKAFGAAPDLERKAVLSLRTQDNFNSLFTIPGAKYAMFAADGVTITRDPANPQSFNTNPLATHLNSIKDKLINGVTINLATHPVTDRREADLTSLLDAYKQHRGNPRG